MRACIAPTPLRHCAALVVAAALAPVLSLPAAAREALPTPEWSGDQLLYFYDARSNRTTFLTVSNFAELPVPVEVAWYAQALEQRLATEVRTLPARGNVVLDPTLVSGVTGNVGLVVITPIVAEGDPRAVVPPSPSDEPSGPLFGGFTMVNQQLMAGFGQNPLGRIAVNALGERAAVGSIVDGNSVRYQAINPDVLVVPAYFNPQTLSPPDQDGNRILLAAFADEYSAGGFSLAPPAAPLSFDYTFENGQGAVVVESTTPLSVSGVVLRTLQELAGGVTLESSGKVTLVADSALPSGVNALGLFSQALGTFAVGQRMPGGYAEALPPRRKVVFVTSSQLTGNLGGITGAIVLCNELAQAEGLDGAFLPWLSDDSFSPAERFERSSVPYVLTDGTVVAEDWADLTDGSLRRPIDLSERRSYHGERIIYTNTATDGERIGADSSQTCDGWFSPSTSTSPEAGSNDSVESSWTRSFFRSCDGIAQPDDPIQGPAGLYCFQQ